MFEFVDNSDEIKTVLEQAMIAGLEAAASEIQSQAQRNTPVDTGQLKGAWGHVVDEEKKEAIIGNTLENAVWTEFGTGEYALEGKGRKGYWVYVKGNTSVKESNPGKARTLEEAKQVVAILRKQGLDAYYTKGRRPVRMLHNAFVSKKNSVVRIMENALKDALK